MGKRMARCRDPESGDGRRDLRTRRRGVGWRERSGGLDHGEWSPGRGVVAGGKRPAAGGIGPRRCRASYAGISVSGSGVLSQSRRRVITHGRMPPATAGKIGEGGRPGHGAGGSSVCPPTEFRAYSLPRDPAPRRSTSPVPSTPGSAIRKEVHDMKSANRTLDEIGEGDRRGPGGIGHLQRPHRGPYRSRQEHADQQRVPWRHGHDGPRNARHQDGSSHPKEGRSTGYLGYSRVGNGRLPGDALTS